MMANPLPKCILWVAFIPKMNLEFFAELMRTIKAHRPDLHIKGFTAVELDYMFRKAKKTVAEGMRYLHEAGLDSLARRRCRNLPSRESAQQICADKVDGDRLAGRSMKRRISWACIPMPPCCMAILKTIITV
jgi:2-iminoacetate synthase ThiH